MCFMKQDGSSLNWMNATAMAVSALYESFKIVLALDESKTVLLAPRKTKSGFNFPQNLSRLNDNLGDDDTPRNSDRRRERTAQDGLVRPILQDKRGQSGLGQLLE